MVKLGSFELVAGTDVKAGEKTVFRLSFPYPKEARSINSSKMQEREPDSR